MPRRRISNRTPRELTPAERKVVSDVVLERDSDFRVKTGSVDFVGDYLPDPGVMVVSEHDGHIYYADKYGWHKADAGYSPITLFVKYDGVTQFNFQFKLPSTSTIIIYQGDGTSVEVAGQDGTTVQQLTTYSVAGNYTFYVRGDTEDLTGIIMNASFVSGDVTRFSELPNLETIGLYNLNATGDVTEWGNKGLGTSTMVLENMPLVTGDISTFLTVGVFTMRNAPQVTFLNTNPITATGNKYINIQDCDLSGHYIDNIISAFKDTVDGRFTLYGNQSRSINSNADLLTMIGNGNLVSVPEDSAMLDLGPELHIAANAASDPNGNEANAITGWVPTGLNGVGNNYFISTWEQKSKGNYSFKTSSNDTPTAGANIKLTLAVDDASIYRFAYNVKHTGEGARWSAYVDAGYVGCTIDPHIVNFQKMATYYTTSSISTDVEFREASPTNDGGLYVDNVSVRKVTLP